MPAQVAQRRVELRGRDREDLSYLAAFDAAYRSLPEADTFTVVDASGPVGDVQTTLRSAVTAALGP